MKKIVDGKVVSVKDPNGIYLPSHSAKEEEKPAPVEAPVSIDDLLKAGLQNIRKAMSIITKELASEVASRETIQNLKDVMGLLKDLKKEEREFLESLSDEELEKLANK